MGMQMNNEKESEKITREVFTINETAAYLGVNAATIYKLVHMRTIKSFKVAKRILIRKQVLDEWIQSQESGEIK